MEFWVTMTLWKSWPMRAEVQNCVIHPFPPACPWWGTQIYFNQPWWYFVMTYEMKWSLPNGPDCAWKAAWNNAFRLLSLDVPMANRSLLKDLTNTWNYRLCGNGQQVWNSIFPILLAFLQESYLFYLLCLLSFNYSYLYLLFSYLCFFWWFYDMKILSDDMKLLAMQ